MLSSESTFGHSRASEGVVGHVLVHLNEAKVPLDMARHTVHEGGLACAGLAVQQVAAVVGDAVFGVEGPRLVLQEPLEVLHQRSLHASWLPGHPILTCGTTIQHRS